MAHFAQLDDNNIVIDILVVSNDDINNLSFPESEPAGIAFLNNLLQQELKFKQTSYNSNFRKYYAGFGYTYSEELDCFIPPKPYDSWVFSTSSYEWEAPIPYPTDGKVYGWYEPSISWVEFTEQSNEGTVE